jgi:hypothetical protein
VDRAENLNFVTPPENQGQIVIVSYACDGDYIYKRTYDQSDQEETIRLYEHPGEGDEEEWGPWNRSPRLGDLVARVVML